MARPTQRRDFAAIGENETLAKKFVSAEQKETRGSANRLAAARRVASQPQAMAIR